MSFAIQLRHRAVGSTSRPATPQPDRRPSPTPVRGRPPTWAWLVAAVFMLGWFLVTGVIGSGGGRALTYSAFLSDVDKHEVASVAVGSAGQLVGTLASGKEFTVQAPPWALTTDDLAAKLEAAGVHVSAFSQSNTLGQLAVSLLPVVVFVGFFWWISRSARRSLGSGAGGLGSLFRSKARVTDAERPATRFGDVAGYEGVKQEVREVVDFLQHPARYRLAGAQGPRGLLLVGPPGTGKTLVARAVAGEASVPFFAVTGSSFVEVFVGLGASRVRDLFAEARGNAPAIVFIDEIDAMGARRALPGTGANDEREQTLNQLLAEMDGFTGDGSIVVIAATNRPEALDPALLRPGRFDRQVQVPLPNRADRQRILAVHARGKRMAADVSLSRMARASAGFSGADLANLVNEAALRAARADREELTAADFDEALDRLVLGRRDEGNALLPQERRAVAVHESGHALVAALAPTADPVSRITILPNGMALGATHQLPEDDRRLYAESYLRDSLAIRVAGRAAELLVLGEGSTGAADDLAGATQLAARMVREYGLSPALGPVAYPLPSGTFLDGTATDRPYAEATQRRVDREVARLLREAEERATELLVGHRTALDALAARLLDEETLDGSVVYDVLVHADAALQVPDDRR
ncbi:ATP-dependent zinc metalloprotease FtsH [Modestobacter marinus]|uniref:ATP-dependent zinc metalloprotease FtsH n=1 Tax=Modestobacter marinus TaxID=477641 RepID=UPI001C94A8D4|nr:ATP-dependent zinc metalloprotease FtsH [Modestobacter marinus]